MKKIVSGLLVLLLCSGSVFAAEVLKNRDFAQKFAHWKVRGGKVTLDKNGVVIRGDKQIFMVQYQLPVAAGKYELSCTVSGSGKYRVYAEMHGKTADGKKFYRTSGAKWLDASAQAEMQKVAFEITPENVGNIQSFAYVFHVQAGSDIKLSNPSLQKITADVPAVTGIQMLKNRDFDRNFAGWMKRIPGESSLNCENGSAVFSGEKQGFLIQYRLPVAAGKYQVSYTVSGTGQYSVYCEVNGRIDGKRYYRSSGAKAIAAPAQLETRQFTFEIKPEELNKIQSFAFVIRFVSGEQIRISQPSLVREKEMSVSAAVSSSAPSPIGGKWHLVNGSYLSGSGKEVKLHQIGHDQIRRSKISGIPVESGKSYRFSCRTHGIATADSAGSCAFRIVPAVGKNELVTPTWDDTWVGEKQIKYLEFDVPAGVKSLDIQFEAPYKTEVGFFDFQLTGIVKKAPESTFVMTSPWYRDTVFSSIKTQKLSGKAAFRGQAVSAVASLIVDAKVTSTAKLAADGTFSFTSPGKDCTIKVEFFDAGNKLISSQSRQIVFPAPNAAEVAFDQDNFMLLNGKRFFPVIFWELTAVKEPDGIYRAARNGVNCFILTSRYVKTVAEKKAILDNAHKYNVKVFLQVPSIDQLSDDKIPEYREKFAAMNPPELRNHPAVIGYFLTDEPIWRGVPQRRVMNGYKIIKEIDPYRPMWINAAPRNTVAAHASYAEASDIYGIDIYPYPYPHSQSGMADKTLTCVGKYTDFCREAVADRKPVWMALQGFSWNSYRNPDDGSGYPGLNQMRFVWYETLFHGGRGGSIWGTRHIRSEAYYDTLFDLSREMHQVSGLFTKYDKIQRIQSQNKDIIAELITVGKAQYLVVRNTNEIPRMSLLQGNFPAMKQLIPAGKRKVDAKRWQAALEPFEVMIFGTEELPAPAYELPAADAGFDKLRDPFKRVTRMDIGKVRYRGNANWIWDREVLKPHARCEVSREFALDTEKVQDITLMLAIDDGGEVFFNGENIAVLNSSYADMKVVEIPRKLWKKDNKLTVKAYDSGIVPAGVLAEIRITGKDGKTTTIVSDSRWQCNGKAADVIAKFGKGAWGNRVSYEISGEK